MTKADKELLMEYEYGIISLSTFKKRFSIDLNSDDDFIRAEILNSIESGDPSDIQITMSLIWLSERPKDFLDLLNILLINPLHESHQRIARIIQDIADPSSILYVKKALETDLTYLDYTCSETRILTKWFSWILYAIGTPEAINLIKEYANSENKGISEEMKYRLTKIKDQQFN